MARHISGMARGFAALCSLAAAALLLAPRADAAEVVRVGKAVPEAFSFTPVDVGIKEGIFAKHGVEVKPTAFHGDAKLQQAMAADGIDFALGSGPGMAFIAKGSPVTVVGALAGAPSLLVIVVKADGPVKSVADLKGKKISVSTAGSLTFWLATQVSRRQGWGNTGIQVVPMGATPPQIAAMERGDIDGLVTDVSTAYDLVARGKGRIIVRFGQMIKDFQTNVIYATNKIIKERPDAVRKFLAGWYETINYMAAHKAETVAITKDVMKKNEEITSRTYDELIPDLSRDGQFNKDALKTLSESFVDMKLLPQAPDMSKLYTTQFLPKK